MAKSAIYRIERKRKQLEELRASEEMAHALLDATADSAMLIDRDGIILAANKVTAERLHAGRHKLIGTCAYDFFPPELARERRSQVQTVLENGKPLCFEDSRDGRDFLNSIYPVLNDEGEVARAAVFANEVTEHRSISEALEQSQQRYVALAEAARDAIYIIDADDRVQYINSFAAELFGAKPADLIGQKRSSLFPREIAEKQGKRIAEVLETGQALQAEACIRIGNSVIWHDTMLAPVRDRDGRVVSVLGISRDITERRQADEQLERSRQQLQTRFRAMPIPTFAWRYHDDDFMLTEYNDAALAITHGGVAHVLGQGVASVMGGRPGEVVVEDMHECVETREIIKRDVSMVIGGEEKVLSTTCAFVPPDLVLVHAEDITERRQAEEGLRHAEARYRSIFENSQEGIFRASLRGGIETANQAMAAMLGYDSPEHLMREVSDFRSLCAPKRSYDKLVRLIRDGQSAAGFEIQLVRRDGRPTWMALNVGPTPAYRGSIEGFEGIAMEINARKRREELTEALGKINEAVSSTLDPRDIMQTAVTEAARAIGCDSAAITVRENEQWVMRYLYRLPKKAIGDRFFDEEIPHVALAALTRRPVTVNDMLETNGPLPRTYGFKSFLAVPLTVQDEVIAAIAFNYHAAAVPGGEALIDFARRLASSVSLSLENARTYADEHADRAKIQSFATQLEALHRITVAISREADLTTLLRRVLAGAAELTLAGSGLIAIDLESASEKICTHRAPWQPKPFGLPAGTETLRERLRLIASEDFDVARFPDWGLMAATLRGGSGEARGHLIMGQKAAAASFTDEDEEIIGLLARQSSVALVSAEKFEQEHQVAEVLQAAMLPDTPSKQDCEVGLVYRSAGPYKVGGDFYDFVELGGGRMAVVLGDVCGKGLDAATYTAMIKYMLRAYLTEGLLPADCLTRLNRAVYHEISDDRFVTVGLALIDKGAGRLLYSSAGHPPPAMFRSRRAQFLPVKPALPLGVVEEHAYEDTPARLRFPDTILMYTDGIIEARQEDGDPFGEQHLLDSFSLCGQLPAQTVSEQLLLAALDFSGNRLRDDIAITALRPPKR